MKINKVVLSSNNNPNYIEFWPSVYETWSKLGVEAYLFYIGKSSKHLNYSENVLTFDIDLMGVNDCFASQCLRLLGPSLFPDDFVIISDVDMYPLSYDYFHKSVENLKDDLFINYRGGVVRSSELPMCYNLAKGSTWREVFEIESEDLSNSWKSIFRDILIKWFPVEYKTPWEVHQGYLWETDQFKLRSYINKWNAKTERFYQLYDRDTNFSRLDHRGGRLHDSYTDGNTDFSPARPFSEHEDRILKVINQIV